MMEHLASNRGNANHQKALALFIDNGYRCCRIDKDVGLDECGDVDGYLRASDLESDNLVFKKTE